MKDYLSLKSYFYLACMMGMVACGNDSAPQRPGTDSPKQPDTPSASEERKEACSAAPESECSPSTTDPGTKPPTDAKKVPVTKSDSVTKPGPVTEPVPDPNKEFERVIPHILKVEGGCADHPNDPEGWTFKGITTKTARRNGFQGDVCTMPLAKVLAIYKASYWPQPSKYQWPLSLAVMNTEVNSGGGRASEFLKSLPKGDLKFQANWFVDKQTDFYRELALKPKFKVFLKGWLNRSKYMKSVIDGELKLFDLEFDEDGIGSAKAIL